MEKFIKQGQIIVGLDFDNSQSAFEITKLLNPENYKVKVGNQLFTACGPQILEDLKMQGFDIFLELWMKIKITLVTILTFYHFLLGKYLADFSSDSNQKSSKFYRIINEVPTIILIVVVFVVVFKPL